jgi:glycerol kinase
MAGFVLGIDQGTSGSRALVLDDGGAVRGYGYRPLARLHPAPDRVEQDPLAVAAGVREAIIEALERADIAATDVAACGIASQRDTDFVWDARTGRPLANAITWQDLRTPRSDLRGGRAPGCRRLGTAGTVKGAPPQGAWGAASARRPGGSPHRPSASDPGTLGGSTEPRADVSLAQSINLWDFRSRDWWDDWLAYLGVGRAALPAVSPTVADFGTIDVAGTRVPVRAMIADQQGALFGHDCRQAGDAEATHGTASFVKVCLGDAMPELDTIKVYLAWLLDDRPTYCLRPTTVTGAAVRWLREGARIIDRDEELGELAASVPDAGGLVFVPAFTGLNVPYDVREARGSLLGMTLGHTRAHIARAFLDSIGFQLHAILEEIRASTGVGVTELKVGGGLSASDAACAIQADWLGIPVLRSSFAETTARAAALLAGIGSGVWAGEGDLPPLPGTSRVFEPRLDADRRDAGHAGWRRAVDAVCAWARP